MHVKARYAGTGISEDFPNLKGGTRRKGEMPYSCDARFSEVRQHHSTEEAAEQPGAQPRAEAVEGRVMTKGNTTMTTTDRTQSRTTVSAGLNRVRQRAQRDKQAGFTSLLHHVTVELLECSFYQLKRTAAPGVDEQTWHQYREGLAGRLAVLHEYVHTGKYKASPSLRRYIPKPDGRQRPLGIAALEDKIVQQALVTVLNQIYEPQFLGFSYGFRPGRSPHDALDALYVAITTGKANWLLDADIQAFFDTLGHEHMRKFLEHRIGDKRVIRLILKWLKVGYVEQGRRMPQRAGTAQGAVISPLLANIYLHYVLDLWAEHWRNHHSRGKVYIVRYADDFVVCFEYRQDAESFTDALRERLKCFGLQLHPDKTRLIEFGRYAGRNRRERGEGKPETFDFLGFTHICARNRRGGFLLRRHTIAKRLRLKVAEVKQEMRKRMHDEVKEVGAWLRAVIIGHQNYYAVPTNLKRVKRFGDCVMKEWIKVLRRRSQKGGNLRWDRYLRLTDWLLPRVKTTHPFPEVRFYAIHPR